MKQLIMLLSFAAIAGSGFSQTLILDLSKNVNATFTQTITPQTVKHIMLINRLPFPDTSYSIEIKKEHIQTEAFEVKDVRKMVSCPDLAEAINALKAATKEQQVAHLADVLKKELKNADSVTCSDEIKEGKRLLAFTEDVNTLYSSIIISSGDMLTVTVKRATTTWTYVFKTEKRNRWKVYYGFTYALPSGLTSFNEFYARQDTGGSFLISSSNSSKKYQLNNFTPTIMFTYLLGKNEAAHFKPGITAGFMADLNQPSAMVAPSLVIGDNLSLSAGIAFIQKNTLKDRYVEGQRVNENLDFDQLHDKIWTYDLFISIGFRFNSNPFKKEE